MGEGERRGGRALNAFWVIYAQFCIYNIARMLALYSRADKGWAVKRARPSKKV